MRQQPVVQAIYNLQLLEQRRCVRYSLSRSIFNASSAAICNGREKVQRISPVKDTDADAWLNLGILYYEFERYNESIESLLLSIKFASENF